MTLVEFLKARLDEDEAIARTAADDPGIGERWEGDHDSVRNADADGSGFIAVGPWESGVGAFGPHAACHDPARVLREVEAKRRIMARHKIGDPAYGWPPRSCEGCGEVGEICDPRVDDIDKCPELRDLAAVYSDHPDYRQEWAP